MVTACGMSVATFPTHATVPSRHSMQTQLFSGWRRLTLRLRGGTGRHAQITCVETNFLAAKLKILGLKR